MCLLRDAMIMRRMCGLCDSQWDCTAASQCTVRLRQWCLAVDSVPSVVCVYCTHVLTHLHPRPPQLPRPPCQGGGGREEPTRDGRDETAWVCIGSSASAGGGAQERGRGARVFGAFAGQGCRRPAPRVCLRGVVV